MVFDSPDCTLCDELNQVTLKHDKVAAELAKFNVTHHALAGPVAREMSVGYAPTIALFDTEGREILRLEAYFRPFHVAGSLDYVSSGAYRKEPSLQRFLQTRAERMKNEGAAVDLWN